MPRQQFQTGITQAASGSKKTIATSADKLLENIENQNFKKILQQIACK